MTAADIATRLHRLADERHPQDPQRPLLHDLADRVERLATDSVDVDASTELTASFGLEPDQEIRDRALGHAIAWVGDNWIGGTRDRNGILDVVETLAAYIRDGSRPELKPKPPVEVA